MRPFAPALALTLLAATNLAAAADPKGDGGAARPFVHSLKPGGIAEECLRLEAGRSRRFDWTADGPVDFNIHFHQGDKVSYPVKVNGQRKASGRFTAPSGEDYCWMWSAKAHAKVTGVLGAQE